MPFFVSAEALHSEPSHPFFWNVPSFLLAGSHMLVWLQDVTMNLFTIGCLALELLHCLFALRTTH